MLTGNPNYLLYAILSKNSHPGNDKRRCYCTQIIDHIHL